MRKEKEFFSGPTSNVSPWPFLESKANPSFYTEKEKNLNYFLQYFMLSHSSLLTHLFLDH